MTKPASLLSGKEKISKAIKLQFWILFLIITIVILLDIIVIESNLVIAKSFVAGAVLSFATQYVVAYLVFKNIGYQSRQKIIKNMYFSELIKWLATIIGFIVIFNSINPINSGVVILGYIVLKASYLIQIIKTK